MIPVTANHGRCERKLRRALAPLGPMAAVGAEEPALEEVDPGAGVLRPERDFAGQRPRARKPRSTTEA